MAKDKIVIEGFGYKGDYIMYKGSLRKILKANRKEGKLTIKLDTNIDKDRTKRINKFLNSR